MGPNRRAQEREGAAALAAAEAKRAPCWNTDQAGGLRRVYAVEQKQHFSGRSPMRILYVVGLMAGIVFTVAASTRPSAAVIIYPWCVNSGGGKGAGSQSCGFTSRAQCELTRAGNGGFCVQNPFYQPYPPPQTYAPPIRR